MSKPIYITKKYYKMMSRKFRRLSVAVDERVNGILQKLSAEKDKTISDIIREAIIAYAEIAEEPTHLEDIKKYEEFIVGKDHVIIDLEVWVSLLEYLNKVADENFWKTVEEKGYETGLEFKLRGMNLKEVFKHLETENLLKAKEEDGIIVLVLTSKSEANIVTHYLKGVFRAMDLNVEIIPGAMKLVVIDKTKI
jgi:SHS2 domain-containing protein